MAPTVTPTLPLNSGYEIPQIGLGTWPMDDAEVERAVVNAVSAGFRMFDTAVNYRNEAGVGAGVRAAGIERDQLFVTTKVPGRDHGYDATLRSFDASLERLGLDYVDLYLIHWPLPPKDLYGETWKALVKLQAEGRARSIGVSNFKVAHIDRLIAETGVTPAVNQIQLHPAVPQPTLRDYHAAHGIVTQSWSPLGQGANKFFGDAMTVLDEPSVSDVADRYNKTPGQIILRWHIELGLVPVPKTSSLARMRENLDIFDFTLDADAMQTMAKFDLGPEAAADSDSHWEE